MDYMMIEEMDYGFRVIVESIWDVEVNVMLTVEWY